jgi:hypothetical protein
MRAKLAMLGVAVVGLAGVQSSAWSTKDAEVGGPATVRRLTEAQYRATIADIFAPDIAIVGRFERELREDGLIAIGTSNAGMSAFSVEQYDASARGVAKQVVSKERREQLVPCRPQSETAFDKSCATQFIQHYGTLLFRRPITSQETKRFVDMARMASDGLGSFYSGLEFSLAGMLVEPDFLLRIERLQSSPKHRDEDRLDPYSQAERLSFFLTNSTPDRELLRAAGAGELDSQAGLARQVDRLMASPRYTQAVRAFFEDMLHFENFEDVAKDPIIYPAYNSIVARDAQEQTLRTITNHLVTKRGDYRELFTMQDTFVTRPLGTIYAMPVATRNGWEQKAFASSSGRAGILTDVAFLALNSHPGRSSPTLRGRAIREIFMCQKVPDPPPDVNFAAVDLSASNPDQPTARHRLEAHRTQPICAGCHSLMDPLGLTLESFDGVGAFRSKENGAVIDLSGSLDGHEFTGATGLGQALHDSPMTSYCVVEKLYRSAVGRNTADEEQRFVVTLSKSFDMNGHRIPDVMREIATSRIFYSAAAAAKDLVAQQATKFTTGEKP